MATWKATDGGRDPEAPVLLVPIDIDPRGREGRSFALRRKGDVQVNLVLLQDLEASFGCKIAPETIVNGNGSAGELFQPAVSFKHLQSQARGIHGFAVQQRAIV